MKIAKPTPAQLAWEDMEFGVIILSNGQPSENGCRRRRMNGT